MGGSHSRNVMYQNHETDLINTIANGVVNTVNSQQQTYHVSQTLDADCTIDPSIVIENIDNAKTNASILGYTNRDYLQSVGNYLTESGTTCNMKDIDMSQTFIIDMSAIHKIKEPGTVQDILKKNIENSIKNEEKVTASANTQRNVTNTVNSLTNSISNVVDGFSESMTGSQIFTVRGGAQVHTVSMKQAVKMVANNISGVKQLSESIHQLSVSMTTDEMPKQYIVDKVMKISMYGNIAAVVISVLIFVIVMRRK